VATKQLVAGLTDIPMRPAPPPPPIQIAAASSGAPALIPSPTGQPTETQLPGARASSPSGPTQSPVPVETALLATQVAAIEPAKPVLIKAAPRPSPTHRVKSLDELIAQIAESR
jgi:hypothetical protein